MRCNCRYLKTGFNGNFFYFASVKETTELEHFNSGKKVSIRFDSLLATESIFSIRFGNLINLPLVH